MRKSRKLISCLLAMLLILPYFNFGLTEQNGAAHAQESDIKINFQTEDADIPNGYISDSGEPYGSRNGYKYGWNEDHTDVAVDRNEKTDSRLDTGCWFHSGGVWEIELIDGNYDVTVSVGDAVYSSTNTINVEGVNYWDDLTLDADEFEAETKTVEISDGILTIDNGSSGEGQTVINYVEIVTIETEAEPPSEPEEDTTPPTVPQHLTVQNITQNEVALSWDSSTDDCDVEGYIVYRDNQQIAVVIDEEYYEDTNLSSSTTFTYEVAAFDAADNISERSEALQVTTLEETGTGIGLAGEYYNGTNFEELKLNRIDETVNFHWAGDAPDEALDPNAFTVRWTGKVEPEFSETYTFYTETHGGIRLWIDNQLLIDDWGAHNMAKKDGAISLNAGEKYDIRMEYCETNGAAVARLYWSSTSQDKEIIPKNRLYPPFVPGIPGDINTTSTSTTVTVTWDEVDGAAGYDIEADGEVIDNGDSTTYIHTGLSPDTQHEYRVRSKASAVTGEWSTIYTERTKIGIPQNINAAAVDDEVTLTWDEVTGATGYDIEVDGDVIDNGLDTIYVHSGLMPGTQHTYRVRAKNENGAGDWSVTFTKVILSSIPTNLQAAVTSNSITLTWDPVPEALSYDVEADGIIIDNGQDTTYIHEHLMPNTQHTYRVRAIRPDGPKDWSALLIKSTLPEPGSGTGLKGEYYDNQDLTDHKHSRIDESVNFDWKNNSPAPGIEASEFSVRWTGRIEPRFSETYTFYIEAHGGIKLWVDNQLLIDDWGAHSMIKRDGTIALNAGEKYDIRMEYRESNGIALARLFWSSFSQDKEIIPKSQLYPIGIPENITTTPTETTIKVEWDEVSFATGYDVEVDGVIHDNGVNTDFTHSNLVPGTLHTYRVRARNGIIAGDWSPSVSRTTLLGKPENITAEATETTVTLSWEPVYGAAEYDVEVDGTVVNNGEDTTYTHDGLAPGTRHIYRVRARSSAVTGSWTSPMEKWTLPGIPDNILATATSTSITVTWDPVTGATGYEIEVYGTPVDTGTNTQYIHEELNPNTQHTYRVRAKNSSGFGKWSQVIAKTTLPGAPTNVVAAVEDTSITVTWDAVAGATAYDIEVDGDLVTDITAVSYLHSGLMPNTTHTYRIRAKNPEGISDWSQLITETTLPSIPVNLCATVTSTDITVVWDEVYGATGYDIEVDGVVIDNITGTSYVHTGLEPNTEHTYRVRSRNGDITSLWSEQLTKVTLVGQPTNLQATAASTEITVTWDPVAGAEGYDIEVDGEVIDNSLNTTYVHTGLTPNTQHTYRVRARNVSGPGDWSETISRTTLFGTPANITAAVSSTTITISWDAVEGATGYDVLVDGEIVDNGMDTAYVHTGLEPNSWHVYRVRAKSGDFAGDWSEAITVATLVGVPTSISTTATSTQITVTWDEVNGAAGYDIKVDGEVIDNGASTTYVHSGLAPNTLHTYRVRAKNENGASDWSEPVEQLTAPDIPANLTATATTTQITLTWDEVDGSTGYDIEADEKDFPDTEHQLYCKI